ncbi:anillin-like [Paramacrobiotus metropolitanus]|uniref:anillin-like n=1 Tax=Paramacrobiotus metropolitanus TaxID=2943436 RepID=UPI0024457ED1|nr:anillin-like [Paramacrobiotus metropolitanus]XP_055352194.1 anillin-like [Paramacrobiotus metropolitanus]XP_055352195.1 anillin-like [Paramacrobiotus metropolitanus]
MSERGIDLHVLDEEAVRVRGVLVGEQSRVSNNSLPPSSADADQPASIPTVPAFAPSPIRSRSPDIPPLDLSQALDDPHPVGNVKDVAESSPLLMGLRQHITDLEAEAEYQETVADQIRRTISAAQKGSAQTSTDRSIISARVEAERTLLVAARKRKGCLAQARRIQRAIEQLRSAGADPLTIQPLQDPSYSAALTFRGFQLDVSSDFLADLKADSTAEYFVVIVVMLLEQVHATEALPLSEFDARGRLLLGNFIQFVDVQCGFLLEVEATLIRVGRQHAPLHPAASAPSSHSTPTHGGNFLKRVMAALPKSATKHADASAGSHSAVGFRASVNPASSELANVMSLGSVTLNVDNYNRKRHVLSEALLVKECGVVLDTEVMLDLEINVPLAAFLTFYCFHDPGSQTEWIRRWCVLRGSTLLMWRFCFHRYAV